MYSKPSALYTTTSLTRGGGAVSPLEPRGSMPRHLHRSPGRPTTCVVFTHSSAVETSDRVISVALLTASEWIGGCAFACEPYTLIACFVANYNKTPSIEEQKVVLGDKYNELLITR